MVRGSFFNTLACARLVNRTFNLTELASLIEEIFSSEEEIRMVHRLCSDDARTFVNVMHQARRPPAYYQRTLRNEFCSLGTGDP